MFGICFLHSINEGVYPLAPIVNLLLPCVVVFVFISGWYGIRFSIKKLIGLYGVALWAGLVYATLSSLIVKTPFVPVFRNVMLHAWFLNAYAMLMVLAPILNLAVERLSWRQLSPFLIAVFIVGFGGRLPVVGKWFPHTVGLIGYSAWALCGIYVVARMIRINGLLDRIKSSWALAAFIAFGACCSIGAEDYDSPFSLAFAVSVFYFFLKVRVGDRFGRLIALVSPSMFFVYLVHSHQSLFKDGHGGVWTIENWMVENWGLCTPLVWLVMALAIFFCGVVLDVPRRLALGFLRCKA